MELIVNANILVKTTDLSVVKFDYMIVWLIKKMIIFKVESWGSTIYSSSYLYWLFIYKFNCDNHAESKHGQFKDQNLRTPIQPFKFWFWYDWYK